MTRKTIAALAAATFLFSGNLFAFDPFTHSPFRSWKTLSTPHFRVHYAEEQAQLARSAARLAERIHQEISPKLAWLPQDATDIVIADDMDIVNGMATPIPFNQMHLIVAPPEAGDFLEVSDEDEWLYQLIKHEYAHILHLDAVSGFPAALRKAFGRQPFLFPSVLQPNWAIEGLATDVETDPVRGVGRGVGSSMRMSMRTEVLGGLKPLQQVSLINMNEWPRGQASYLYGVHFYQFLRERYGEAGYKRFLTHYRGNIIPFRIHKNARLATGKKNMDALWAEFHQWLRERYEAQLNEIRQRGVVEGVAVTAGGKVDSDSSLVATPDGSVYYVRGDTAETAALMRRTPDGRDELLTQVHEQARFDVHPTAGIVLAQREFCDNERFYYDLYRIPAGKSRPERVTHCARYRQVAWHPNGQSVFAIRMENGKTSIDKLNLNGTVESTVWVGNAGERASQLAVSPAGKRLVFVRSRKGEGTDLVAIELEAPLATELTRDRNSEVRPRFTPDGKAILFSSDHGGVSNLQRLDLESGRVTTLTNTLTGAFAPSQAVDGGPIWYITYTPKGYDLARLDQAAALPLAAADPLDPSPIRVDDSEPLAEATNYNPWIGLKPRSWWPIIEADNARTVLGASTGGSDALNVHHYQAALARDLRNDTWLGSFAYLAWERLFLGVARTQSIDSDDDDVVRVRNVDNAWLGVRLPYLRYDHRWGVSGGLVWEREKDDWRGQNMAPMRETRDGVVGIAVDVDTTRPVPDSAGPTAGRRVLLGWETSDVFGNNDYSGDTSVVDWREYLNLSRGKVLAARLGMAYGDRGIKPYELGGSFNESVLAGQLLPFNRRDIDLRSYDDGDLRGRGYQLASLEWRTPVMTVDRTWTTPPLGLTRLSGSIFAESARMLGDDWGTWHSGVGTELIGNVVIGYRLPVDMRLGAAWGFDEDVGGGRFYLSLGYGF